VNGLQQAFCCDNILPYQRATRATLEYKIEIDQSERKPQLEGQKVRQKGQCRENSRL
jgi:hypothetical protein